MCGTLGITLRRRRGCNRPGRPPTDAPDPRGQTTICPGSKRGWCGTMRHPVPRILPAFAIFRYLHILSPSLGPESSGGEWLCNKRCPATMYLQGGADASPKWHIFAPRVSFQVERHERRTFRRHLQPKGRYMIPHREGGRSWWISAIPRAAILDASFLRGSFPSLFSNVP